MLDDGTQVHPVDLDLGAIVERDVGLGRHVAAGRHHGQDDAHGRKQQRDAAGDERRPQETAAVFPVLAPQQPSEGPGGTGVVGVGRTRGIGQGVSGGVHA
jgi:hypothetical protein